MKFISLGCFINFFRKLMKTKIYPDNPVDPVEFLII